MAKIPTQTRLKCLSTVRSAMGGWSGAWLVAERGGGRGGNVLGAFELMLHGVGFPARTLD